MKLRLVLLVLVLVAGGAIAGAQGLAGDPLDPAHNVALPCEAVSTPGLVPRAAKNIAHVANVCGFVGTDIEFQSRKAADGTVHDYAFVGTMGAGTRIFDVTDPAHPVAAGALHRSRLPERRPGGGRHARARLRLALAERRHLGLPPNEGKRNRRADEGRRRHRPARLRPRDGDLRDAARGLLPVERRLRRRAHDDDPPERRRTSPSTPRSTVSRSSTSAPLRRRSSATSRSRVVDDAHDVSFSRDGNTLYSAGLSSTRVVDVTGALAGAAPTLLATIPNSASTAQGADGQVIQLSHQSDTSSDGKVLVVTDEAGGGITRHGVQRGSRAARSAARTSGTSTCAPAHKLGTRGCTRIPVLAPRSARARAGVDRPHGACVHDPRLQKRRERQRRAGCDRARVTTGSRGCPAGSSSRRTTEPAPGGSTSPARRAPPTASPRTRARPGGTRSAGT